MDSCPDEAFVIVTLTDVSAHLQVICCMIVIVYHVDVWLFLKLMPKVRCRCLIIPKVIVETSLGMSNELVAVLVAL